MTNRASCLRDSNATTGGYSCEATPSSITTYTVTDPAAQGATGQSKVNNGSGIMSWGVYTAPVVTAKSALSLTSTIYLAWGASGQSSTTETDVQTPVPSTGSLNDLYVQLNADPGNTNTVTVTLRDNAAGTTLTCTITGNGSTGKSCNDTTHSVSVTGAHFADYQIAVTGTISATPNVIISARWTGN
jgi:hypothetical protein